MGKTAEQLEQRKNEAVEAAEVRTAEIKIHMAESKAHLVEKAEHIKRDIKEAVKSYVGRAEEAEDYAVDNEYIQRGYRINHDTNGRVFKSLCTCHNETVNIWSHGIGVVLFIFMLAAILIWIVPKQL